MEYTEDVCCQAPQINPNKIRRLDMYQQIYIPTCVCNSLYPGANLPQEQNLYGTILCRTNRSRFAPWGKNLGFVPRGIDPSWGKSTTAGYI